MAMQWRFIMIPFSFELITGGVWIKAIQGPMGQLEAS
jgi:hypothetical protein